MELLQLIKDDDRYYVQTIIKQQKKIWYTENEDNSSTRNACAVMDVD